MPATSTVGSCNEVGSVIAFSFSAVSAVYLYADAVCCKHPLVIRASRAVNFVSSPKKTYGRI